MARELFIDASAWVALTEADDRNHEQAKKTYARAIQEYDKFVTTNLVIAESHALVRRDLGHPASIQFLGGVEKSLRIIYIYSSEELETRAKEILRKFKEHAFSYADAVSFALIQERGITDVFTYDHHFRVMGFRLVG